MPFLTSLNPVMMQPLAEAILAALSARPAAALLTTPTCHLYITSTGAINPGFTPGNFTEASFEGYNPASLGAFFGPILLPGTEGVGMHVEADFLAAAPIGAGQNIFGYYIDDNDGNLYYAETFDNPIPIAAPGDFISLDVIWIQPEFLETTA